MTNAETIHFYLQALLAAGINVPAEVLAASERQMNIVREEHYGITRKEK